MICLAALLLASCGERQLTFGDCSALQREAKALENELMWLKAKIDARAPGSPAPGPDVAMHLEQAKEHLRRVSSGVTGMLLAFMDGDDATARSQRDVARKWMPAARDAIECARTALSEG